LCENEGEREREREKEKEKKNQQQQPVTIIMSDHLNDERSKLECPLKKSTLNRIDDSISLLDHFERTAAGFNPFNHQLIVLLEKSMTILFVGIDPYG
jgi:hypothetical protein